MEPVLLQFLTSSAPYRAGEVAGFAPAEAQALIDRKVARQISRPAATEAAAASASADEEKLVVVRFRESMPPYMAGELAGFSHERAEQLVRTGVAEPYGKTTPKARPEPVTPQRPEGAAADADLVRVQFVRAAHGYRVGEVAGFPAEEAERLIASGAAVEPGAAPSAPPDLSIGDPDAATVGTDVEVLGLDDRDPDWRDKQKAQEEAPADKMSRGAKKK